MQAPPIIELDSQLPDLHLEFRERAGALLQSIKHQLPELEKMLTHVELEWAMEDGFYRFYHQSFKVYELQTMTTEICNALRSLAPERPLNRWFAEIVAHGTGHEFELAHNQAWVQHTRPIVEAFFHAHYFLKLVVKCGQKLETAPDHMPSGWAAVLCLYDLR